MRADEWNKLKRFLGYGGESVCPICNEKITEDCNGEGVTYSKTKAGGHMFIHEKCLKAKGEKK